jgi:hypothetical protein
MFLQEENVQRQGQKIVSVPLGMKNLVFAGDGTHGDQHSCNLQLQVIGEPAEGE